MADAVPDREPSPSAAEVLAEKCGHPAWCVKIEGDGADGCHLADALLAYGGEHGVTIRPDGSLEPAAPPLPEPPSEEERERIDAALAAAKGATDSEVLAGFLFDMLALIDDRLAPSPIDSSPEEEKT